MSSYSLPNQSITNIVGYLPNSSLIGSYTAIDSNNSLTRTYTYDSLQRVTSVSTQLNDGGTLQESYTYVSNGNRTSSLVSSHTVGNTAYIYLYDALGNITRIYEEGVLRRAYTYDSLGQLISETVYPATGSAQQYQYTYDKSGNVTNVQYISGSTTQNKTYTYGNTSWGDLLTNYNGTAITYDAVGNPTKWRNAVIVEWYGRQMSLFAHADGAVTNYTYNADGIRTGKQYLDAGGGVIGTVKYTLDGSKIVAENRNGTNLYYLYDDNGSVMGISYGDNTYTFAKNIQGDVIGIYSGGTLLAKYEYNAYGQIMSITNASGTDISGNASHIANINPFRYRGYYYDTETGFYYLQSRYYDPVVGRFLNADDVAMLGATGSLLSMNVYVYCENNPVNLSDMNGYFGTPIQWICATIGAIAGNYLGDYVARAIGLFPGKWYQWQTYAYWIVRAAVIIGGAVAGYVAGTKLLSICKSFLLSRPEILNKLPVVARWFLGLGGYNQVANDLYEKYASHIFSKEHIKDGIMKIGSSQRDIFDKLFKVASNCTSKFANGDNLIITKIKGYTVSIKLYFRDGMISSFNAYIGKSDRKCDNIIYYNYKS